MIEIRFIFPEESDAHKANAEFCKFFQGSKAFIENNIVITPVKKDTDYKDRTIWNFYFDISRGAEDTDIEKYTEISGGLLNLVTKGKDVWAFALGA